MVISHGRVLDKNSVSKCKNFGHTNSEFLSWSGCAFK